MSEQQLAATGPTAFPAPLRMPPLLAEPMSRLRGNPMLARAALPVAVAGLVAMALIVWLLLSAPDRAPLYSHLPDADKAAVVETLTAQGFDVALDPRTGAVMVPPDDHARARMLLAAAGLPKAAPGAADLLADLPLGSSRAVEGARLKAAQERDLARSIESLNGVDEARVLIAQPEPSPFLRERAPVTASVTLKLAQGRTLSDAQARAIVHLVAGAVPGLTPDAVAIADQSGRLLSGEPGSSRDRADDRRLATQARMEARTREAIMALLVPMVGAGNVSAQVSIDLDFAAREASAERYDPAGALRSEALTRATSSEPRAIGIPGALSNTIPAAATVAAEAPTGNQTPTTSTNGSESSTRNFELGRTVEVTSRSGGEIRRLTAAVAISAEALGPPDARARMLKDVEALVQGAVGYDAGRGDRIAVAARSFAPQLEPEIPFWREPVLTDAAKWLAGGLVAVALLAFVVRPMVKRLNVPAVPARPQMVDGGDIEGAPPPPPPPALIDYGAKLAEARLIAASDTARATAVARRLLSEEQTQ